MPGNKKKHRRGNGEGSIYQRKDGTWAAVLTIGVRENGKPDRKFFYGKTRKEVADKLRDAQNKLDIGVVPGGDNVLFSAWIIYWVDTVIKPGIKDRTYRGYKMAIDKHIIPGLGRYRLKDLTEEIIQSYLTAQQEHGNLKLELNEETGEAEPCHGPVAASSIIQQRRLIIAALDYAVDKGKIAVNHGKKTKRPKSSKGSWKLFTDEEMKILGTEGKKYRYYPAYMLTLTTGCRRGEILGLSWDNFDIGIPWHTVDRYFPWGEIEKLQLWDTVELRGVLTENGITLGDGYLYLKEQVADDLAPVLDDLKTENSKRCLVVTEEMVFLIIFWRMLQNKEKRKAVEQGRIYNKDNLVFCTRKGTYIIPRNFTKMWSENLKSMGIEHKRFHDLRHTVATVMLEDGEAITTVSDWLGHYDAGFTASRYGHVTAKMRNSAATKLGERLEKARDTNKEDQVAGFPVPDTQTIKKAAYKIK